MTTSDNRRTNLRMSRNDKVSIQILLPGPDGPGSGQVLECETLDVSREGICVRIDQSLEADHFFDFCVELCDYHKIFLLTGEIRWCRPDQQGLYQAGILVHDGERTDFDAWNRLMASQEEPDSPTSAPC